MDGQRLIHSLSLKNFLSYGSEGIDVELQPLNVLIGANGSGKSNFIEAISLLQATPTDFTEPIRRGGGISEWLWKGSQVGQPAEIVAIAESEQRFATFKAPVVVKHTLSFNSVGQSTELIDETIENANSGADKSFYRNNRHGYSEISAALHGPATKPGHEQFSTRLINPQELAVNQSILAQRTDPDLYPVLSFLAKQYQSIKIYTEWNLGRYAPARLPQNADLAQDFLSPDTSNLSLVLNDLLNKPNVKRDILGKLKVFYENAEDLITRTLGGTVTTYLQEAGLQANVPASRLSDGTLKFLCLLAILSHPKPPPLICIEEPEIGLHPDILPTIAEMLIEASQRTQLIVTTHSDSLVSALGRIPEAILVCDRTEDGSQIRRLEPERLGKWLDDYSLGELWRTGEIGGVRY